MVETRRAVLCYIPCGRLSLMIHRDKPGDFLYDTHVPPGGGIEPSERPIDCARREAKEETGLDVCDIMYRGTVLFDHSGRVIDESQKKNQSVDIFCAGGCSGVTLNECESGSIAWRLNSQIPILSKWNGWDYIFQWLRDGRLFDAVIKHGTNSDGFFDVAWTGGEVSDNPYRHVV